MQRIAARNLQIRANLELVPLAPVRRLVGLQSVVILVLGVSGRLGRRIRVGAGHRLGRDSSAHARARGGSHGSITRPRAVGRRAVLGHECYPLMF